MPPQSGPHFSGPPTRTHPTTRVHAAAARNSLVRQLYPPTDFLDPQDRWPTCSDWGGRIRDTSRDTTQLKAALSPSPPPSLLAFVLLTPSAPPHPHQLARRPATPANSLSLSVGPAAPSSPLPAFIPRRPCPPPPLTSPS
jgi:hypothetical protein